MKTDVCSKQSSLKMMDYEMKLSRRWIFILMQSTKYTASVKSILYSKSKRSYYVHIIIVKILSLWTYIIRRQWHLSFFCDDVWRPSFCIVECSLVILSTSQDVDLYTSRCRLLIYVCYNYRLLPSSCNAVEYMEI